MKMNEKIEILCKEPHSPRNLRRRQAIWKTSLLLKYANRRYKCRPKRSPFELQVLH